MNHRERVEGALNHETPDRTPMDLGGGVSTLTYGAYEKLAAHLGIRDPKGKIGEFKVMVEIDEEILQELDVDFRNVFLNARSGWEPTVYEDGTFTDEWGIRYKDVGYYTEMVEHPLAEASIEDLETFPWPDLREKSRVAGLEEKAEEFHSNGYAVALGSVGGRILEQAQWLRGLQAFMEDLILNVEFAEALMDRLVAIQKDFFLNVLEEVGEYLTVVCMGDDLSTQSSLFLSPRTYKELIKPRHSELYSFVKERCRAKIMHHSCGAVYPLIRDLIETGVDILNPVQPLAHGMDRARLKKEFGNEICFWGGIDEQRVLPFGTIEEVEYEVNLAVNSLGKNGGYVLSAAHNIQPDVKPENILAMYQTGRELRSAKL